MLIKKVSYNKFDCFLGTGWENWVRLERTENKWSVTNGKTELEAPAIRALNRFLTPRK